VVILGGMGREIGLGGDEGDAYYYYYEGLSVDVAFPRAKVLGLTNTLATE